ncbi:TPA: ATP-binding protein [Vibrio parahaemolyticus]|uniref:ATP-binding protein n=1 Tax=Vibrio parahaemolyticus TaxID=670 RepID=UPI000A3CD7D6|nr:ATP-binding protein [Vibrio parahaemolyticus]EGQ7784087.1 ATP-binding protein [Vibrio parahaemolyticus]MCC4209592.1 DUF87 domain-containing protein [Vibrio parahaemolyticus]MDF4624483.1 ATP-binding protein [Vibrio parahaemolyticus]OUJ44605.1 hypothetical protein BTZ05_03930 [Vibrio parahaemolyticus]TOE37063.1 DUF87 domain-containing protein [Vibrio parahaemolyticus]
MSDIDLSADEINSRTLIEASKKLVPWWQSGRADILKVQTEQNSKSYLDSYYLFPLNEISVNSDCDDIPNFINERFQNILAAASHSRLSVLLALSCKNGRSSVFLGFKSDSASENRPELFESIVNGLLPGKKINLEETVNISSLADGCIYGGMVTGVPILKNEDGKQKFNLSSVARSLYGRDYLLAVISRPVSEEEKQHSFSELVQLRDRLHVLTKQTIGEQKGYGTSVSETETATTGSSKTSGHSAGATGGAIGAGIGAAVAGPPGAIVGFMLGNTVNYSHNRSNTETESTSKSKTETTSENQSSSITIEQQNGYAVELEKIADQYIERMIQGFGSGYWETSITFATQDKISSDILAGTFAGELSKPNGKLLPPPRIYLDSLEEKVLFIPKVSSHNSLFPKSLASYITSEELSLVSSPPVESIPGYEIQKMPTLALSDICSKSEMILGSIADHGNPIHDTKLYLSKNDVNKHLFVCGLTGSGKTTTVKHILKDLVQKEGTPFLVLESAKRDYRQLLANEVFKDNLNIFTIGDATVSPIRFNPFYIQEGVHPLEHIDYLKAIFNASFSLYGPMPSIVEKCLHAIYTKKGWDLTLGTHPNFIDKNGDYDGGRYQFDEHYYCFPTLTDLKDEVDRYIKTELDYKGELRDNIRTAIIVRLESLCVGAKGLMFNTHDFFAMDKLLDKNTILEMESLADDDDKAFFVGLVLVLISEYRQKENPAVNPGMGNKGLRHFMVIEEAHRLLKNVETERSSEMMGNPKGKAVEVFCNILAEMRSLGQGVAVVEQIPSKISPDVIKNSNTKIVHRLVSKDDQSLLAGSLSIDDYDALYLNRLKTGHALCHKEGMGRPVECSVLCDVDSHAISDDKVKRLMTSLNYKSLHSYQAYQIDARLGDAGREFCIRFLNSLITIQVDGLNHLVGVAHNELNKLLTVRDVQCKVDNLFLQDYFSLQVMVLLNKGIYARRNAMPNDLKAIFSSAISNPTKECRDRLVDSLNLLWQPFVAGDYINDIIANLTIQYLYKNDLKFNQEEVEGAVSSFLLCMDNDLTRNIARNICKQLEGRPCLNNLV